MVATTLPLLDIDPANAAAPVKKAVGSVQEIGARADAFAQALKHQNQGIEKVAASNATPAVNNTGATASADDQTRARRALALDGANATQAPSSGDTILGGMQKIRGFFDVREHNISDVVHSNLVDQQTMLNMQREMVQYTMLLDITSKLTGKAAQVVDQLMKGQ
ncbi:type III secretion system inner rod subunit SctI [Pseudochelatococcus sp. G4_1912]|uniref:type III secretion system inner rod subunit SctI n=1 Tax=Pseudochelatococcus sp. G4_1912 TaxID=3114288 RepID=UPI0039C6D4AC